MPHHQYIECCEVLSQHASFILKSFILTALWLHLDIFILDKFILICLNAKSKQKCYSLAPTTYYYVTTFYVPRYISNISNVCLHCIKKYYTNKSIFKVKVFSFYKSISAFVFFRSTKPYNIQQKINNAW